MPATADCLAVVYTSTLPELANNKFKRMFLELGVMVLIWIGSTVIFTNILTRKSQVLIARRKFIKVTAVCLTPLLYSVIAYLGIIILDRSGVLNRLTDYRNWETYIYSFIAISLLIFIPILSIKIILKLIIKKNYSR